MGLRENAKYPIITYLVYIVHKYLMPRFWACFSYLNIENHDIHQRLVLVIPQIPKLKMLKSLTGNAKFAYNLHIISYIY